MGLLSQLKLFILATEFSREKAISVMKELLVWLSQPENNTDSNCKQADSFISLEIMFDKRLESLPEDIKSILFDMGATLHDTHTATDVAKNFQSTPSQLLSRVQNL